MKTLKESILSSTNTGKEGKIKEWCKKYEPFYGDYVITKDLKIAPESKDLNLTLDFLFYDELPGYIKFEKPYGLNIGASGRKLNIKNFRGIPEKSHWLRIVGYIKNFPKLEIETNTLILNAEISNMDDIYINNPREGWLTIINFNKAHFDKLHFSNLTMIKLIDKIGEEFARKVASKAPANIKWHPYYQREKDLKTPIGEKCEKALNSFFGTLNLDNCESISYSKKYVFVKHNNQWYKVEN